MEYRRRSLGVREYSPPISEGFGSTGTSATSFTTCSSTCSSTRGSPTLSRRRSASPLYSAFTGSNSALNSNYLHRNRQEATFPLTEEEHLILFHERIIWNQERSLLPLAHDLSDWLNGILGLNLIPSNLVQSLETGEILFKLAKLIEEKAAITFRNQSRSKEIKGKDVIPDLPRVNGRMRGTARRGSFFARDNIAMFLAFCKQLGIHSNLLFETEDLVSHGEIRNILICLMEVGRIAVKYGVDPPSLVSFEQQIDREIANGSRATTVANSSEDEGFYNNDSNKENPCKKSTIMPPSKSMKKYGGSKIPISSSSSLLKLSDSSVLSPNSDLNEHTPVKSKLDLKVNEVAEISGKNCSCVEDTRNVFKLRKLSEGKYFINGRTVFVRLLKGVHVMVRIGGGWETLEEFLVRNDPCRTGSSARRVRSALGNSENARVGIHSSAPATPCCEHVRNHPLLQRPLSTPPSSKETRALRSKSAGSSSVGSVNPISTPRRSSVCSITKIPSSQNSSRSSLLI